jgi:hypothetical protein
VSDEPAPSAAGIPAAALEATLAVVRASAGPIRRRALLEELERKGHRISLAGLNRILDYARRSGWIAETPEGVRPTGAAARKGS